MNESSRPTVLVVDDEPNIVLSLEFLLAQEGYKVVVADDGARTLEILAEAQPDLVLLDVMLPGIDGFELCRRIHSGEGRPEGAPRPRIIMLTAKGQEAEKRKGLALGADRYVTKPFSTRDLMDTIRGELDQR